MVKRTIGAAVLALLCAALVALSAFAGTPRDADAPYPSPYPHPQVGR